MSKANMLISVDSQTKDDFIRLVGKGNASKTVQEFMESCINTQTEDTSNLNKQEIQLELEQELKSLEKHQAEVSNKKNQLEAIELKHFENEKVRLQQEKENADKVIKCISCGNNIKRINIGKFQFKKGSICSPCFYGLDPKQIKKFN